MILTDTMRNKIENNTVLEDTADQESDYKYNFIDTPWDDRSQKSKICIIGLLCAIFVATMALVTHNLIVFYTGFESRSLHRISEISCNIVKVDKYRYAARIHSVKTKELLCIGAMVTTTSVLASAICLKSGSIRLYLGSLINHRCKKGFSVEAVELIRHDGVVTKNLVLLLTRENLLDCGNIVRLGREINMKRPGFIIGRPFLGGRSLSFQPATLAPIYNCTRNIGASMNYFNKENLLCVMHLPKCPVRAGDLLMQNDRLIGLASTSEGNREGNSEMTYFANLSLIHDEIKDLDQVVELHKPH